MTEGSAHRDMMLCVGYQHRARAKEDSIDIFSHVVVFCSRVDPKHIYLEMDSAEFHAAVRTFFVIDLR